MKNSVHVHLIQSTLHFKGHQQFVEILREELSGKA